MPPHYYNTLQHTSKSLPIPLRKRNQNTSALVQITQCNKNLNQSELRVWNVLNLSDKIEKSSELSVKN